MVWRLLKMKGRQYDKTHLVSWWVGRYSRRGLPLRGRGAYGPVLTHGPRVVAADAAGAEALVGVLKIIKDASYNKTREPPWRAMEMRHPLWWLGPPPLPKGTGFSGRLGSPTNPVRWSDSSSFATPAELGALWTLASVPHDSVEERRAVYSVPRMGWQGNTIRKGAKRPENRVTRFPVDAQRTHFEGAIATRKM